MELLKYKLCINSLALPTFWFNTMLNFKSIDSWMHLLLHHWPTFATRNAIGGEVGDESVDKIRYNYLSTNNNNALIVCSMSSAGCDCLIRYTWSVLMLFLLLLRIFNCNVVVHPKQQVGECLLNVLLGVNYIV